MMQTVQMTLDEELVKEVDSIVKKTKTSRSAFTRDALAQAIRYYRQLELEKKQQQGYLKHPISKGEFDSWEDEQVWRLND